MIVKAKRNQPKYIDVSQKAGKGPTKEHAALGAALLATRRGL
jgi:hypothetical protein